MATPPNRSAPFAHIWPRRRTIRLASGLVLFTYVTTHLVNHALGLISLTVAEGGLALAVRVWHSWPGTLLLYSSAAVHVVLAFYALYERRSLRIPTIEWIRIVMGFGMPVLLIGHVIATRAAFEIYGLAPEYTRIIRGLWNSGNEWLQLGLLAPGWIHGCLGLHIALAHRRLYRRSFLVWFSVALLLPVLSGLGFLAMSKEVIANAPKASVPTQVLQPGNAQAGIQAMRHNVLNLYLWMFGLLVCARAIRNLSERYQRSVVKVHLPRRSFSMPRGWTVLEGMRSQGIKHPSVCGGRGRCSTCRVEVISNLEGCPSPVGVELDLLNRTANSSTTRLACQLRPTADVAIAPLFRGDLAQLDQLFGKRKSPERDKTATEHECFVLLLAFKRRLNAENNLPAHAASVQSGLLPNDERFLLQQLVARIEPLLHPFDGAIAACQSGGLILVFPQNLAAGKTLSPVFAALARVELLLVALEAEALAQLALDLHCRLYCHYGPVLLGELEIAHKAQPLILGHAVDELSRAKQALLTPQTRWFVSENALAALGMPSGESAQSIGSSGEVQLADPTMFARDRDNLPHFFAFNSFEPLMQSRSR